MSCLANGTLPIYIALIRNFTVVMNTTNIASSRLYQEGNYTCVATSKYGTDVKHFVIKGGEKIRYFETNPMQRVAKRGWGGDQSCITQGLKLTIANWPKTKTSKKFHSGQWFLRFTSHFGELKFVSR